MAQIILSPLLDVIKRNLSSAAIEELRLVWGVDEELENLKSTLSAIHAVLEDAEDMQFESKAVKDWLEKLQDVAYDADDLVDDMAIKAQQSIMESETGSVLMKMKQQVCNFLLSCFSCITQVGYRREMAHRIEEINKQLDKINKEKAGLHLQTMSPSKQSEIRQGRRQLIGSVKDESEIFGRRTEKDQIIKSLLFDGSNSRRKFSVVAIIGMGGQGKTTLAQLVYNDEKVKLCFDLQAWVCVSQDFDVIRLTKEIIESASGSSCDLSTIDALQCRLHEILKGKIFLLVLDDVWNENSCYWDQLQGPFASGEKGSKIMVTTRSQGASGIMRPKCTHNLDGLPEEDCLALFSSRAFGDDDVNTFSPRLVEIGKQLMEKCRGLPLAAKVLGELLSSTRDEQEWENVLKNRTWELDGAAREILPALRLSYQHLPARLKRCFTFCSVYPKDREFEKQELVRTWIAQGFIQRKDEEQIEDTASRYFNDFVQNCFFQQLISRDCYVMHDLFHDLAQSIAGSECINASDSKQQHDFPKKARHLSLNLKLIGSANFERIHDLRGLRTLLFRGNWKWTKEVFKSLKFLRVLELEGCDMPNSIGSLWHLRFLKFENHTIKELPESICSICNLQTLILNCHALVKLPNGTSKLSNLRHLQLGGCYNLESTPPGIGRLTHLQTLSVFIVGREEERGIEELKNLTNLRGSLKVRNLERVENADAAQQANLKSKSFINELKLKWNNCEIASSIDDRLDEKVAERLQPHPNVKKLHFHGYLGTHFPRWMMKSGTDMLLPNLTDVTLDGCRRCSILPSLGKLPSLVNLRIREMDKMENMDDVPPTLTHLSVTRCANLKSLPRGLHAFTSLQYLTIASCPQVQALPEEGLPTGLQTLYIRSCPELEERCNKDTGEDWPKISHIPYLEAGLYKFYRRAKLREAREKLRMLLYVQTAARDFVSSLLGSSELPVGD